MKIEQMEAKLEQAKALQLDLEQARRIVDALTNCHDPEFPVFAAVGGRAAFGASGRVALPSVARSVVLEAARAQVDTILAQFRDLGVEP